MKQFIQKLAWYPPAETKIPLRTILSALASSNGDFHQILCNYLGVEKCILGNSGRALLALLLKALWKRNGKARKEVLIPGYTCYSVAASVVRAGLKINIYDLDPGSFNPDIDDLKKKIGPQTLAVICQHLFGIPSDIKGLMQITKEKGSYVIEDAAQALGASMDGDSLGTIGDFGFFSFGRGKSLPMGAGGALIGKGYDVLKGLTVGQSGKGYIELLETAVTQIISKPLFYRIPEVLPLGLGETIFDPGFDISPMPDTIQRLGQEALVTLKGLIQHRRHIGGIYQEVFHDLNYISAHKDSVPVYTRFPLSASAVPIPKDLIRLRVRRMYPNAIAEEQTIKPYLADSQAMTPGASEIACNLITLPTHMGISETLAEEIAGKVKKHFGMA